MLLGHMDHLYKAMQQLDCILEEQPHIILIYIYIIVYSQKIREYLFLTLSYFSFAFLIVNYTIKYNII